MTKKVKKLIIIAIVTVGVLFAAYKGYHYAVEYATKKITKGVTKGVAEGVGKGIGKLL